MPMMMMMMMMMTLRVEWWLTDDGLAPMADSFRSANFVKTEIFHNARPGYCVINGSSTIWKLHPAVWQIQPHELNFFSCICSIFLQSTLFCGFHNDFGNFKLSPILHLLKKPYQIFIGSSVIHKNFSTAVQCLGLISSCLILRRLLLDAVFHNWDWSHMFSLWWLQ